MRIRAKNFEKLIDHRSAYKACVWPVAHCGYQAVGGWINTREKNPSNSSGSGWRISHPLEDSDLFLTFAALGSKSKPEKEDLEQWTRRFGLLLKADGASDTYVIEDGYGEGDSVIKNARTDMKEEDFLAHAKQAFHLLNLYKDVRSGNADRIWRRASKSTSCLDRRLAKLIGSEELVQPSSKQEGEYYLWHAALLFSEQLTERLAKVRLIADIGDQGATVNYLAPLMHRRLRAEDKPDSWPDPPYEPPHRLMGSWACPDLLSAIYFQFHLFVTGHKPERRCKNPACGQLFIPTRNDQVFCKDGCRSTGRKYLS